MRDPETAGPPGARTFGLEGRAAPGLYFAAWLSTILGVIFLVVALLAGGGGTAIALSLVATALLSIGLVGGAGSQAIERLRRGGPPPARPVVFGEADEQPAGYHGPSPFLVFAATLPPTILVVALVVAPFAAAGLDPTSPAAALLSVAITGLVSIGVLRLVVVGTGSLSWREMGVAPFGRAALRELAAGALIAVPVIVVTALLAELLVRVIGTTPESPLPTTSDLAGLAGNLVAAGIVAPVAEELFYRGFATTAWARALGERRGLIRGALFFAVVHVIAIGGASFGEAIGQVVIAFVGRLPVSLALGWVFLRRRSLYAAIGLHAAFNVTLLLLAELAGRIGA